MVLPATRHYPKAMADIFDVVSDPTRRELMVALLERGETSVGELVERLGLSQPTVSKHLKVLRDHSLVTVREEGQHRYYRLDITPLEQVEDWLVPFLVAAVDEPQLDDGGSAVFSAWSGTDVGDTIGRRVAEGTHRARTLPRVFRRRLFRRH